MGITLSSWCSISLEKILDNWSKMAKYILFLGLVFTLMAIVEINAIEEFIQDAKEQLDNLGNKAGELLNNAGDKIKDGVDEAKDELGINSSTSLSFSFAAMLMSFFYTYIVG